MFGKLKLAPKFQQKMEEEALRVRRRLAEQALKEMSESDGEELSYEEVEKEEGPEKPGRGLVLISGRNVHGKQTRFISDLGKVRHWLIVRNPGTLEKEKREVKYVAGDSSLIVDSAFGFDLSTYSEYWIQSAAVTRRVRLKQQRQQGEAGRAKKIAKSFDRRVKKGMWSYHTIKVEGANQEQEVAFRTKHYRDRYC